MPTRTNCGGKAPPSGACGDWAASSAPEPAGREVGRRGPQRLGQLVLLDAGRPTAGSSASQRGRGGVHGGRRLPVQSSSLLDPQSRIRHRPHLLCADKTYPRARGGIALPVRSSSRAVASARHYCRLCAAAGTAEPSDAAGPGDPRDGAVAGGPGAGAGAGSRAVRAAPRDRGHPGAAVVGAGRRGHGVAVPGRGRAWSCRSTTTRQRSTEPPPTWSVDNFLRAYLVDRNDNEAALFTCNAESAGRLCRARRATS